MSEQPVSSKKDQTTLQSIVQEVQTSYLDYAMSVIVSRALPDVRDGLKPVHRRVLYAMWDMGLRANAKFRKSATVVGEVMGKYHPHGDMSLYEALVRLAQKFSMRYPLVHGQGNFGSVDGDAAAAMRYTESKLSKIAEEMLYDIEKDTVLFRNNYDGSHKEPSVLPSKLPNLILNGTLGIAVGMATNIPPHNLGEVCDAVCHLIENPEADIDDLMNYIKGPDFPTGGVIFDKNEIKKAYATGKGSIVMRAKAEIIEEHGMPKIAINEIPYQVNKALLIEKIAELVKEGKLKDIKGMRDESDRTGMRITIDLKKDSFPKKILNQLYKHTRLQDTFHVNMVALVDGIQPRVLTLKMVLEEYIKHRQVVVRRRTEFDLQEAKDREHILTGLVIALENIDAIIETIKKSKDKDEAKVNLIKRFSLTERQSIAILEMRLQVLAGIERLRVEKELEEKRKLIKELEGILASKERILSIIREETENIKKSFGDKRNTSVFNGPINEFSQEDLVPNEPAIIMITKDGYIKRVSPQSFKSQGRGGKGVIGLTRKEADTVLQMISTNSHASLLFFTNSGKVYQLKAYELPENTRTGKGSAIVNFLDLKSGDTITALVAFDTHTQAHYLVMATKQGFIKKVDRAAFENVRRSGLIAITLREGDTLRWVHQTTGKDDIILTTAKGRAICFNEKKLRQMGRGAQGVTGIKLAKEDSVVGMDIVDKRDSTCLITISERGYGKMTALKEYRLQARAGKGIKAMKITKKTGLVTSAWVIDPNNLEDEKKGDLILISEHGQVIRFPLRSIPRLGRSTQGVRLMKLAGNDTLAQVAVV